MQDQGKITQFEVFTDKSLGNEDEHDDFIGYSVSLTISDVLRLEIFDFSDFPTLEDLEVCKDLESRCGSETFHFYYDKDNVLKLNILLNGAGGDLFGYLTINMTDDNMEYVREICKIRELFDSGSIEPYTYQGELNVIVN